MSSAKALNAILPLIATGQAYEAHQKARTFAARYAKSNQPATAISVLFESARELLKAGQPGSGADLSSFMLEVYDQADVAVDEESRGRVTQLIALMGPSGSWRKTLIDKSVAWSAKHGDCPGGDPDLHHYIGELLYREGAYTAAEPHLLAAGKRDSARALGEMMAKWAAAGGTPGAFALRGTLPYLLDGNVCAARAFLDALIPALLATTPSLASSLASGPMAIADTGDELTLTTDPVLNWAQLAVRACQRARGADAKPPREAWVRLCGTYQARGGLLAQPGVRAMLHEVAALYFAIPMPRAQAANPMADMLSAMLGGGGSGGGSGAAAPSRRLAPPQTAGGLD